MSIFGDIEKLITEHGSAAILREKVGLLELQRAQAAGERDTLATQLAQAKKKVESLESERANLQAQIEDARQEIQRLKQPGKIDIIGPLMHEHASKMIERVCQKIDYFANTTPTTKAREYLLAWLRDERDETEEAITSLRAAIKANEGQGGLGSAVANLGHATNLKDQNRLKRVYEAVIRELEDASDSSPLTKIAERLKQVARAAAD